MAQQIYGKNVFNQLKNEPSRIIELYLLDNLKDVQLKKEIEKLGIDYKLLNRKKMDQMAKSTYHQGVIAVVEEYKTFDIDVYLDKVDISKNPILVMCDGLQDPHNLGAILRTCDCVGVDGIIIPKNRTVGLTSTVAKVSTGAIETVKTFQVANLNSTIKKLKDKGFWVIGSDANKAQDYDKVDYKMPVVLVVGSEGNGMSDLVKKNCDIIIKLPMNGSVTSLNASVATGIMLYQILLSRK